MKCDYCGKVNEGKQSHCKYCGGELKNNENKPEERKYGPTFYNGYIVYFIDNFASLRGRAQFWLGVTLIDTVEYSREILREFVSDGEDMMPFIFKLFELSQGKEEVLKVQERNKEYPAMFELRRVENMEKKKHIDRIKALL